MQVNEAIFSSAAFLILSGPGMLLHLVGNILLGVAVWHSDTLPRWAGEYDFLSGEKVLRVGAGSLKYVPKGTLHSHKNVGEGLGKMLVVQTPGGLYEGFFEKVGKRAGGEEWSIAFDDGPEVRRIVKTAAEYGIEIPLPIA